MRTSVGKTLGWPRAGGMDCSRPLCTLAAVIAAALALLSSFRGEARGTSIDAVIVIDNSEAMEAADSNFYSIAASSLLVDMLRRQDRLALVSCGSSSSVVLSGRGDEKEKFLAALGMMKRESVGSDPVETLKVLRAHFSERPGEDAKQVQEEQPVKVRRFVLWLMSGEIRLNVKNEDYHVTEKAAALWTRLKNGTALDRDPFRNGGVKDLHREIFPEAMNKARPLAKELESMGVQILFFVVGNAFSAPGLQADVVNRAMQEIIQEAGGRLVFAGSGAQGVILDSVVSAFAATLQAPTITASLENLGGRGESFEVYRKSKSVWVVLMFRGNPPKKFSLSVQDHATGKMRRWPFGKRGEDVVYKKPELEKGQVFKTRRWYRLPKFPVGYGLFAVVDPSEGIYTLTASFQKGEEFLVRILQEVELEFGFLTQPPTSISVGEKFSAVAGLKDREGGSYTFHRSFLNDLEFTVEMEKEGGGVPAWGESRRMRFSKEGEVFMSFTPASPGNYYVQGKVTHKKGEFMAELKPLRVEVFHRVRLDFVKKAIRWKEYAKDGWFTTDGGIALAPDVDIPEGLSFELMMDWSKVSNRDKFEVKTGDVLKITHDLYSYPLSIRYRDPSSLRWRGAIFEGPLYLSVKEGQKHIDGAGRWEIKVRGEAPPWTLAMYWAEHAVWLNGGMIILLLIVLVVERLLRPRFRKNMILTVVCKTTGETERRLTLDAYSIRKPVLPFRRARIFIGADGSINDGSTPQAVKILPDGKDFVVVPLGFQVKFMRNGVNFSANGKFKGRKGEKYLIGDGDKVEFWFADKDSWGNRQAMARS